MEKLIAKRVQRLNDLEEQIALEWYGVHFDELEEDERGEVSFEAHDRMEEE